MIRPRPVPILIAQFALVATLALGVGSARADTFLPTLYVKYAMNCTFTITNDAGAQITQIPPGSYQLFISTPVPFGLIDLSNTFDMTACKGFVLFSITGPGVNIATNLEFGDNETDNSLQPNFQPNSTYVAQDGNQPTVARKVFTTAASGAPAATSTPVSTPSSAVKKGTTQSDVAGSAVLPFRGALDAIVYASGKLALAKSAKAVSTLQQGRYTIDVDDESTSKGFTIQRNRHAAVTVTTGKFKGDHAVTITMKPGQWFFYSPSGKKSYFIVVA